MKFFGVLAALLAFAPAVITQSVTFDQLYDEPGESLDVVACSDGINGLESQGFTNFSSLPSFPNIGGAVAVAGFNSPNCGTCWELFFEGRSIFITAIDHASPGFNIALEAMNNLTNGLAEQLGRINVTSQQVPKPNCGLPE